MTCVLIIVFVLGAREHTERWHDQSCAFWDAQALIARRQSEMRRDWTLKTWRLEQTK